MLRAALLIPLALAGCAGQDDETDTEPSPRVQAEGSILEYGYAFDVWSREATSMLTVDVDVAGNCMDFDYDAGSLDRCLWNGAEATCEVEDSVLTVCGDERIEAGQSLVVETAFTVPAQTFGDTDIGYQTQSLGADSLHYMVTWFGGCSAVGPCDEDPATFATFRWDISHRPGEELLCPGEITSGETQSTCVFEGDGGPVYSSMGFAVSSAWSRVELGSVGGVDLVWYDLPEAQTDHLDIERTLAFFAWAQDLIGPYPYGDELRFFSAPTYWAGFEHPGNISMNVTLRENTNSYRNNPLLHTTIHEIGHMWAGNQTTLASYRDFVWKEATVEYLALAFEDTYSDAQINADYWKLAATYSEHFPVPEEDLEPIEYYGDAYGPGPMIMYRQLEAMYSREVVLEAVASFLSKPGVASVDDIREALEEATGDDLEAYFDTWLIGSGTPVWPQIEVTVDGSELVVVQDTADGEVWPCAFHVRVIDGEAITDVPVRFELGATETTVRVPIGSAPVSPGLVVDPFSEALVYGDASRLVEIDRSEVIPPHPFPHR